MCYEILHSSTIEETLPILWDHIWYCASPALNQQKLCFSYVFFFLCFEQIFVLQQKWIIAGFFANKFHFDFQLDLGSNAPGVCLHKVLVKAIREDFLEEDDSRPSASQSNVASLEHLPVFFSWQWLNNAVFMTSSSFTGNTSHLLDREQKKKIYQKCFKLARVHTWTCGPVQIHLDRIDRVVLFSLI